MMEPRKDKHLGDMKALVLDAMKESTKESQLANLTANYLGLSTAPTKVHL